MAEGTWEKFPDGRKPEWHRFVVDGNIVGSVTELLSGGGWRAVVYPPEIQYSKDVAYKVTETEAKAAVEEYWANKTP